MHWEESFTSWAKAPGQTEQTKCDNAVGAVQKAKDASPTLSKHKVRAFAQGSYCNRTNVRQDSDVDVCLLCTDSFFYQLPADKSYVDFQIVTPAPYQYKEYKDDVEKALTSHFVNGHVKRGKKAFDIKENTYRIAADAVPCFEYRNYRADGSYDDPGVAFLTDDGSVIVNWPEQNYKNGVVKNTATGGGFKDIVRVLKTLRYKMLDEQHTSPKAVPSFLVECLVWNVPNGIFVGTSLASIVRDVLATLFNGTTRFDDCKDWDEVNCRKKLFGSHQAWAFQQAHTFISDAWEYLGFQ